MGRTHRLHDAVRVVLPVEVKARHAAGVDRLDQHIAPGFGSLRSGPLQVGDERGVCGSGRIGVGAIGAQTHHGMDARAVQGLGINQGLFKARAELGLAPGHAGSAPAARFPSLAEAGAVHAARGRVEQHLLQAVATQSGRQLFGGKCIREQVFHRFEAVLCGRFKAVQKRQVGVHHGEVGCKAGHGCLSGLTSGRQRSGANRPGRWPEGVGCRVATA